jgi:hypothetical protein
VLDLVFLLVSHAYAHACGHVGALGRTCVFTACFCLCKLYTNRIVSTQSKILHKQNLAPTPFASTECFRLSAHATAADCTLSVPACVQEPPRMHLLARHSFRLGSTLNHIDVR